MLFVGGDYKLSSNSSICYGWNVEGVLLLYAGNEINSSVPKKHLGVLLDNSIHTRKITLAINRKYLIPPLRW